MRAGCRLCTTMLTRKRTYAAPPMSPSDVAAIVKDLGGICAAASLADVSRKTMSRYVQGRSRVSDQVIE